MQRQISHHEVRTESREFGREGGGPHREREGIKLMKWIVDEHPMKAEASLFFLLFSVTTE